MNRELDYLYAPTPHNMLTDPDVSAEAIRVWGLIHLLKWNKIDPKPETIAEIMDVHVRSVRRWLGELAEQKWIIWNHNCADPWKRFILRADAGSVEAAVLTQVRALFASGTPTIEEIRAIIDPDDSDSGVLSDSGVPKDSNDPKDSGVRKDTDDQTTDSTITGSDPGVQTTDSTITGSDRRVPNGKDLALPEASNGHRREVGVGGPTSSKKRSPTTPLEAWLAEQGMVSARRFAYLDESAAKEAFSDFMRGYQPHSTEWYRRLGALVEIWKMSPPQPAAPTAESQRVTLDAATATARARRIAPEATEEEIELLAEELRAGASSEQALDLLATRRWLAENLPAPKPEY